MSTNDSNFDAFVIGSGPNGLSAAIALAQQGLKVKVIEAKDSIGGGTRTEELNEPGFYHDVCSTVHATALSSPFLSSLPLDKHGLEWAHPEFPVAHPLEHGEAVIAEKSLGNTLRRLGGDSKNYRNLFKEFIDSWEYLSKDLFGELRIPNHPLAMMRFGWYGMFSCKLLSNSFFDLERTKAYFSGLAAHSILPLEDAFTASYGLVLGTSVHTVGWPVAKGGSKSVTNAMAQYLRELDGEIELGHHVQSLDELPSDKPVLFDLTPHQIVHIADSELSDNARKRLLNYKYGPGVFKVDFSLSEQVPWKNEDCKKAGTLHLGGTIEEIIHSEKLIWNNEHPDKPYVLAVQASVCDNSRAPEGKHTLWTYCHVPHGSTKNMEEEIINQVERYAPGFRDTIIAKSSMNSMDFEKYNPNYIGGDIVGGSQNFGQLFARPLLKWDPYKLPGDRLYICSSSTPPGGGVHGMCGYNAAKSALKNEFGIKIS